MDRRLALVITFVGVAAAASSLASCGARTGLLIPPPLEDAADADAVDARDTSVDTFIPEDTAPEPIDVLPAPDVPPICDDPSVQFVYVVTESNELLSFYPPTASFNRVGRIACPARGRATPFSMAVDRKGTAYVVFNDGELFEVSVKTASCKATTFKPPSAAFNTFGMGFAAEPDGSETLYVASSDTTAQLARIRLPELVLETIGTISPRAQRAELTGTGAGQLFAFWTDVSSSFGSSVGALDKATAKIVERSDFPTLEQGTGWAFAFWGGDFYLFTAPDGARSDVTRFRPSDRSLTKVTSYGAIIVGAGVSTCAPGG
jgi:hypothetical protein